jgi:peptidoglycan/LPS O-acetylase OafA/YrhL
MTTTRAHAAGAAPTTAARASAFRTDVQALRAVAVMAVVLYHLWPSRLPGGFVGVDIFFVISGFLITQHLMGEISRTGRIALGKFWARRIRRLLPAAFTVIAVSLVLLFAVMPRVTWQENLQQLGASAAYVENWLLGFDAVDYLAAENSATLAQHYWSLSVEEQFYVVWPIVLLAALLLARLAKRGTPRSAVRWALIAVFLGSLAVSVVMTARSPELAFFATPTRAWEFAAGGLLALFPNLVAGPRLAALRAAMSWAGLAIIAFSAFFITGALPFPGVIALVPVLGAVLVIAGGTSTLGWSPSQAFGLRPVQWLGDYSYSIYLWHWPLIIAAPWVLHGATNWISKLVILAVTLVLAVLTKKLVEDPLRSKPGVVQRRRTAFAFAAAGTAALVLVSGLGFVGVQRSNDQAAAAALVSLNDDACFGARAMVAANACDDPFARPADLDTAFAASDLGTDESCQQTAQSSEVILCRFGETTSPSKTIVVVGNSHALRLVPALKYYGASRGWEIILAAKTDCTGASTTTVPGQSSSDSCVAWSADLQQKILSLPRVDGVVFASHASAQDYLAGVDASASDVQAAKAGVLDDWTVLDSAGIPVVVVEDVPGMRPQSGPECIAMSNDAVDPCALPRSSVIVPNLLTELAQQNPSLASYVTLDQYLCDSELCHSLIGGVIVYSDSHHLTGTFSRSLGEYLGADVDAATSR